MSFGTVLVIDDAAEMRDILSALFEGWGFDVVVAEKGDEGVALARDIAPRLILLDLNMPGVTGFATARKIRANAESAKIPMLAVTGLDTAEDRDEAHLAGCDAVVAKPIDAQILFEAMSGLIGPLKI